jgi:hypothetical protein
VILDGFEDGAVAVQDGPLAVGIASRPGSGAKVDFSGTRRLILSMALFSE